MKRVTPPSPAPVRPKIRVFLAEDHPIVRRGFQMLIGLERDLVVCGEAESGPVALEKILALKPDLAVVDLALGTSSGLELIKQLHNQCPKLKVLVFTMRAEVSYVERALRAGAHGYLTKEEGTEKALEAIRALLQGKTYLSERIAARMVSRLVGGGTSRHGPLEALTDREVEVLELIGKGLASRDVAECLHISIKTVESHREHLKSKLGLSSASELVSYAFHWAQGEGEAQAEPELSLRG
jgi:DNA-binding NarL/FixJ family response regulator